MLSLPLLFAALAAAQPMDTGLVVQAQRFKSAPDTMIELRVWNASLKSVSGLSLVFHFNGAPGSLDDLGFMHPDDNVFDASGIISTQKVALSIGAPVAEISGCTGNSCPYSIALSFGTLSLDPLQGVSVKLKPMKQTGGALQYVPPTHVPDQRDWSFSNLGSALPEKVVTVDLGPLSRATRIEAFSNGVRVWGNAPGEFRDRPEWPLYDARKSSFAAISRVPSDTVPVALRDARNRVLGRWLVNQAGYRVSDVRTGHGRVLGVGVNSWQLLDSTGNVVGSGTASPLGFRIRGRLATMEYANSITLLSSEQGNVRDGDAYEVLLPSNLPAGGPYRIASVSDTSVPFIVHDDVYGMVRDAVLRYFGVQRSGNTSSWFRGASFTDDPIPGGWYDCGDRLKEGITQGYAMDVLGELAATHPERDPDHTSFLQSLDKPDGTPDILRELRHGADYALASWDQSGKNPANMIVSVGAMNSDHLSWLHDAWVGIQPANRGGPASRTGRKEMGGNTAGSWAAGLAFAARLHATSDPTFSVKALEAARNIYAWGKANPTAVQSPAYMDNESSSRLALAAIALLWATRDTAYLHDLMNNDSLSKRSPAMWKTCSGWLGKNPTKYAAYKGTWYMDYGDPQPLVHHALLKLIFPDPDTAARYGVDASVYDTLRERVMAGALINLGTVQFGSHKLALPEVSLSLDSNWTFPVPAPMWGYSRYFSGNLAEMLLYADFAREFQKRPTLHYPAGTDFRADTVEALAVRGMDYLLGQNPWDMSFLLGVGSRNLNHIHHRTANPEGRNYNGVSWPYRTPVGALMGGGNPEDTLLRDEWEKYDHTESCLDFATTFLVPATLLAAADGDPISGIGLRGKSKASLDPVFRWDARTGMLRWRGAAAGIRYELVDLRGKALASGVLTEIDGSIRMDPPSGVSVLRWRSGEEQGRFRMMRSSR